jgi:hypothetical protein
MQPDEDQDMEAGNAGLSCMHMMMPRNGRLERLQEAPVRQLHPASANSFQSPACM